MARWDDPDVDIGEEMRRVYREMAAADPVRQALRAEEKKSQRELAYFIGEKATGAQQQILRFYSWHWFMHGAGLVLETKGGSLTAITCPGCNTRLHIGPDSTSTVRGQRPTKVIYDEVYAMSRESGSRFDDLVQHADWEHPVGLLGPLVTLCLAHPMLQGHEPVAP